jgi:hypothetical protein
LRLGHVADATERPRTELHGGEGVLAAAVVAGERSDDREDAGVRQGAKLEVVHGKPPEEKKWTDSGRRA